MKKRIAIALAILMIAGLAAVAGASFADSHTTPINALINRGISMTWDGSAFEPRENDGGRLHPIVYNGRTYLPAKFVADKAGVDVDWDASTQTVSFTSRTINIDLTTPYKDADTYTGSKSLTNSLAQLPFIKFNLEIEGDDDDDELDVEFELYSGGRFKAEVEIEVDDRKEMELTGLAAMEYLLRVFEDMNLRTNMSKQEIVNEVIRAFNWTRGYEEFELEVRFSDGTRIDIDIDD